MTKPISLLVHIGHGKTGSTSLQHTLEKNRSVLIGQGVGYLGRMLEHCESTTPQAWQHPDGAVQLLHQMAVGPASDQIEGVLRDELQRLASIGVHTAIWSNEGLFARREAVCRALLALRGEGVPVRVLVYLRRHDKWARSAYAQWGIRHKSYEGPVMSFADWIKARPVHFADNLEFWDQQFGPDLLVRNFETTPDVVGDVLALLGVEDIEPIRAYETPPVATLIAWAVHNSRAETEVQPDRFARLLNASGMLAGPPQILPGIAGLVPDSAALAQVLADSQADIARINRLLVARDEPTFDLANPATGSTIPTDWEMMQFMMAMVFSLQEQVLRLRRRLDELEP